MKDSAYLALSEGDLAQVASDAVNHARSLGIAEAAASASQSGGVTIKVRGDLPEAAVQDGGQSLSITVFDRGRRGQASTAGLDQNAVRLAVEHAVVIARQVEEDVDSGLPDTAWLARRGPDVPMFSPAQMSAGEISAAARAVEDGALAEIATRAGGARVVEAAASSHDLRWALVTTGNFSRAASASIQRRWSVVIAERGGLMAQDFWQASERRTGFLPEAGTIGMRAVTRATRKLGARSVPTQAAPVLFDATVAATLVFDLVTALTGTAQYRRSSFLLGAMGRQVLAPQLDLVEDPFEPFGLASAPFDGEGIAGERRHIVRGGVIEGYFLDVLSARKLGLRSTGNAQGPYNLTLTDRKADPADELPAMLRKLGRGLWVTEMMGGTVDRVTGAFSKAAAGFWVADAEVAYPVRDITIAGNLTAMLRGIVAVGADVYREGSVRTGSVLLESLQIAGR